VLNCEWLPDIMQKYIIWIKRLLIAALLLAVCSYVFMFSIKNSTIVDLDLLFIQLTGIRIELAMVASFIFGGFFGLLASIPFMFELQMKNRRKLKNMKTQIKAE